MVGTLAKTVIAPLDVSGMLSLWRGNANIFILWPYRQNITALHEVCLFYRRPHLGDVIDQLLSAKATCINYEAMHKRKVLHLIALYSRLTGSDPNRQLIPMANKNITDSFGKNVLEYLLELCERKVRAICSCCQSVGPPELAPTLVKNLTKKERIRLRQPEKFDGIVELGNAICWT
ncbi:hypothetical protein DAPPUDRAFT_326318 [Daphnia pulex]|uniref:Uncharacterized protein n=1 Tax=Daphnia pulex TaxID=6669 RepID=E9H7D0_DAPPU|nr:hypothetical protein DAPPUDRAFT_326318 [Daphnia pulex]|eukprot:EFX72354.1 hypothetical protein DAPPUDRAFT_326318 [Daphnia pulex]